MLQRYAINFSLHATKFSIQTAFIFALPFFLGQYTFQLSLSLTAAPVVNIVSSTSGLFTLILSSIFPTQLADRFSFIKFILIVISIGSRFKTDLNQRSKDHSVQLTVTGVSPWVPDWESRNLNLLKSGTVLISSSKIELEHEDDSTMIGAAWALVSAMCYAIYLGMFSLPIFSRMIKWGASSRHLVRIPHGVV